MDISQAFQGHFSVSDIVILALGIYEIVSVDQSDIDVMATC